MFNLAIVTPEKVHYELEANALTLPGSEGYLGVLSHHAPLITVLKVGRIEFRDTDNKVTTLSVSGGFLEVSENKATILADTVEVAEDIDIERAQKSYDRAQERISTAIEKGVEISLERAKKSLERALNRIKLYKENH